MTSAPAQNFIHANALVVGTRGLLIRGPSGAGTSALTLALIWQAQARGDFASLVGDDRIALEARAGRLIARAHPSICGLLEARGAGLLQMAHEPACVLHAIVDLSGRERLPDRYPEEAEKHAELMGVSLPRLSVAGCNTLATALILDFIQRDVTF